MDNYFIFNGVTYVIIYDDKKIKILKKVDNKLVELDKSEKKKIESFLILQSFPYPNDINSFLLIVLSLFL